MGDLEWGETPFHRMTQDQMMEHCHRLYSAVTSLTSCLAMSEAIAPDNPYFTEGSGGRALSKGQQALKAIQSEYEDEQIYRSFYRYADDLLFDEDGNRRIGSGWVVCPACDVMVGDHTRSGKYTGKRCGDVCVVGDEGCEGIMRPLEWGDLALKEQSTNG